MMAPGSNGALPHVQKVLVMTTPRRQRGQRSQVALLLGPLRSAAKLPQAPVQPDVQSVAADAEQLEPLAETRRAPRLRSRPSAENRKKSQSRTATELGKLKAGAAKGCDFAPCADDDPDGIFANTRFELVRLRKRLHLQACELQGVIEELEKTQRELRHARAEADEMRLKHSNLERIDRVKSTELLEERRKNDEMSKQVKEMSANLLSLCGEGYTDKEGSGLRKRCFKLVQQNTALTVQERLLQRQKGWAEAKARVLQNEVTRVYLGVHDQVKDANELEAATEREYAEGKYPGEEAQIYTLQLPADWKHQETVIDFLTHITHTHGHDIHGFLKSSRVFNEAIRSDCLSALAHEFYELWRVSHQNPLILRAVDRVIHLSDYLAAFSNFSVEVEKLLCCAHAKVWVVDRFRHCLWTCLRVGDSSKTLTCPLPRGKSDLTGAGLVSAAHTLQKPVNVTNAAEDPRFRADTDADIDGIARSCLCVPVAHNKKVSVVVQAVNKTREPHFDPTVDVRILRLLGRVSMEVLQVCETSSAATMNTKRKEALLQLFTDTLPCTCPSQLLYVLERGLELTFLSQAAVLHLVIRRSCENENQKPEGTQSHGRAPRSHSQCGGYAECTARLALNRHELRVALAPPQPAKGIVGHVAKTLNQFSVGSSQLEGSWYDPAVDLPMSEHQVLHTVPICEGAGCAAVCQFICVEKERDIISDDGAYHPENTSHFRLLSLLLTFVQKHLYVAKLDENTGAVAAAAQKQKEAKEAEYKMDEEDEEDIQPRRRSPSLSSCLSPKKYRRTSPITNTKFETVGEPDVEAQTEAAVTIQRHHRRCITRKNTSRRSTLRQLAMHEMTGST